MSKLQEVVKTWPEEAFWRRLEMSRAFLYLHDFLSEGENAKVKKRIKKAIEKEQKAGTWKE